MIRIESEPIDASEALRDFARGNAEVGAVASFVGRVRGAGPDGTVARLELEHYPGFTEAEIEKIAHEACTRWPLLDVLIIHRTGAMRPGEDIVVAAAAAAHRREALDAVDFMMDCLKSGAPFWKKETGAAGERWIEPREDDHRARSRWID